MWVVGAGLLFVLGFGSLVTTDPSDLDPTTNHVPQGVSGRTVVIRPLIVSVLAVVSAARNRGLLVRWLLVCGPLWGFALTVGCRHAPASIPY